MPINKENLQRAITHMKSVNKAHFTMSTFIDNKYEVFNECNSTGCTVGHCSVLEKNKEKYMSTLYTGQQTFKYADWSEDFFEITVESALWDFMFSEFWCSSKKQAIRRMKYVLKYGSCPEAFLEKEDGHDYCLKFNKRLELKTD